MTLPLPARIYLWLVTLAAIGSLAVLLWGAPTVHASSTALLPHRLGQEAPAAFILILAELVLLAILAQHFPLAASPRRKFDVSIAVHFAMVLVAGGPLAVALVGLGEGLGQFTMMCRRDPQSGRRRRTVYGALFNTSQFMLAAALAGQAGRFVAGPLAVPATAAVLYLANSVVVAGMAALHQRQCFLAAWCAGRRWSLLQVAAMLPLGWITARVSVHEPLVPLLMALPAGLTFLSLKRTDSAEAAVHARDDFLRLAAHELKTPMTSLRGYTQLLLRRIDRGQAFDGADTQQRAERALRIVDAQAAKLAGLIDQLLDLSRLDVGKLTLDCRPVELTRLARDLAAALQPITPDYRLVVRAPSPVWALADPLRLEQVVTNLLTNAARYAAGGDRIEVHVDVTPDQRPRLAVRDYGVGIAPEQRDRIFDRYYQAPRPGESGGTGGMGIGLFVCRQITERLGGTIHVEAPPDGGARFVIVLPHYQSDVTPLAPALTAGRLAS